MTRKDSILLLASRFADRGDWTVEQQFILQMGSSYLLAHGIGTPLEKDAVTSFSVPEEGDYTLWVRTKNWIRPWSDGPAPGIFQVLLDGRASADHPGDSYLVYPGNRPSVRWMLLLRDLQQKQK